MNNSANNTQRSKISLNARTDTQRINRSKSYKNSSDSRNRKPQQEKSTLSHESILNSILNSNKKIKLMLANSPSVIVGTLVGYDAFTVTVALEEDKTGNVTFFKNGLCFFGPLKDAQ